MNDNAKLHIDSWIKTVEEEWGFRPISCAVDETNQTVIAKFGQPLNVKGEMRIHGFTIIPQTMTHHAEHPFNAQRHGTTGVRTHRFKTQHML